MNVGLLKELTEAHGISGQEGKVREIVRREMANIGHVTTDSMGNVTCVKAPNTDPGARTRLMIAAHMDEIGFVVKYITDKGFLRLHTIGGWDLRMMSAQRVIVHTESGPLKGVLMEGRKPKHLLKPGEAGKEQNIDDFFVDVGMDGDKAKATVQIGDMVVMDRGFQEMGDLYTCKAMDDRVAVFCMIEALRAVGKHSCEVHAVATVQEEIGLRGATASGWSVQPDIVVALDVTLANDFPGIPEENAVTRLGQGTAIKFMDSSLICHPKVFQHFRDLAKQHNIRHQIELLPMGGTDAGGVQRLHGGIPAFTLSIPTRYIHTVNETVNRHDVQATIDLLARYIEDCANRDYSL